MDWNFFSISEYIKSLIVAVILVHTLSGPAEQPKSAAEYRGLEVLSIRNLFQLFGGVHVPPVASLPLIELLRANVLPDETVVLNI